jgi:hypothetical protein
MLYLSVKSENKSCGCQKQKAKTEKGKVLPFLFSLALAILPKCPFCIFGYSSVLTMCSGASLHSYQPTLWSFLPILLAFAVSITFFINYKGQKTIAALALTSLGTFVLYYSTYVSGNLTLYFAAVGLIFFAVFVNGSFTHFYRRFLSNL